MRTLRVASLCFFAFLSRALAIDDFLDRLSETLTISASDDRVRAQLRGTLDFEIYHLDGPGPSLLFTNNDVLLNPRLSLFLDAQLGPPVYVFVQGRVDRGFDPNEGEGVTIFRVDQNKGTLEPIGKPTPVGANPSFVGVVMLAGK